MECQRCGTAETLEVCLFCGNAFCSPHRGQLDGVTACTACIQAEHERRRRPSVPPAPAAAAAPAAKGPGARAPGEPIRITELPKAPPPLTEPRSGTAPVLLALGAAGVGAGYLYWLLDWLQQPPVLTLGGALGGALFVLVSVWIIAKTRMSS